MTDDVRAWDNHRKALGLPTDFKVGNAVEVRHSDLFKRQAESRGPGYMNRVTRTGASR